MTGTAPPTAHRERSTWLSRLAAVLEVVGVLLSAILLGRLAQGALGVESWKGAQAAVLEAAEPNFWRLARLATIEQVLKYGFMFALIYGIGRWHRNRRLPAYGLRLGETSAVRLVAIGIVGWAAAGALPYALQTVATIFPTLGQGAERWQLFPTTWSLGFVVFMAAGSFVLPPLTEELWARGYMVTRLGEDYGRGGGVLLAAVFFALAHRQYFKAEVLSIGMLISLVVGSIIYAYLLLRTGSLLPPIVSHALINLPPPPTAWAQPAILAVMLVVLVAARRSVRDGLSGTLEMLAETRWSWTAPGLLALIGCLAAAAAAGRWLPYLAPALLVSGLLAEAWQRRAAAR